MQESATSTTDTRERILAAALAAFGHNDYDSVGVRRIVEAAGANIAAVSYYFGGKKGLYLATAEYLAESLRGGVADELARIEAACSNAGPSQCREMLSQLVGRFAGMLLSGPLGEDAPSFIFREQNRPTEAFDLLYEHLFAPLHRTMARLVACARGLAADDPEVRLVAHGLLGTAIAFRAARSTMLRHLGREDYSGEDLARIGALVRALTASALDYEHRAPATGVR